MPAFAEVLSNNEIWAVLAFIKHSWPLEIRARQQRINEQWQQRNLAAGVKRGVRIVSPWNTAHGPGPRSIADIAAVKSGEPGCGA